MKNDGGKGSVQRPTHHELFSKNFEAIFGKKPTQQQEQEASEALKRQLSDAVTLASDPSGFKQRGSK